MKQKINKDGELSINYDKTPLVHLMDVGNLDFYEIKEQDGNLFQTFGYNDQQGIHTVVSGPTGELVVYRSEGNVVVDYDEKFVKISSSINANNQ